MDIEIFPYRVLGSDTTEKLLNDLEALDITTGVAKAAVFGFIISLMGCYNGYKSRGGAQGVGNATTNAVVSSSILILIFNYLITEMFFSR